MGQRYVTAERSAEDIAKRLCLAGTPKDCARGIQERVEAGTRDFVFTFLAHDYAGVRAQMGLLARRVLPNFW